MGLFERLTTLEVAVGVTAPSEASKVPVRQLLYINVQRFRGGLVFKAHRLVYHSTLGLRVIKKKKVWRLFQGYRVWEARNLQRDRGS